MPEMPRINSIWAFLSVDPEDGNEGVIGANIGPGGAPLPLIASDKVRLDLLLPIAEQHAAVSGQRVVLVEFTTRVEVREIGPKPQ